MSGFEQNQPQKIPVLFVNLYAEMGGGEYAVYNLAKLLDPERFEPIFLFNKSGPFVDKIEALGVKTVLIPYEGVMLQRLLHPRIFWSNFKASLTLRQYIKAHSIQIIHCTDVFSLLLLLPAFLLHRIQIVYNVIMYYNAVQCAAFNVLGLLMVRCIVAPSQAVKNFLVEDTIGLKKKVSVIHNGVDCSRFFPRSLVERRQVRESLKIPNEKKVIGLISRFEVWKGHLVFLDAAKILLSLRHDIIFMIVGGATTAEQIPAVADYRDKVLRRVEELRAGEAIRVLTHQDDAAKIIGSLDVLVCPSDKEAFGLVVLEAFVSGVPVVASRTVGALEVLNDAKGIVVSEPNDPVSLARQIEAALEYRAHLGGEELSLSNDMLEKVGWERYARRFEELYHNAMN